MGFQGRAGIKQFQFMFWVVVFLCCAAAGASSSQVNESGGKNKLRPSCMHGNGYGAGIRKGGAATGGGKHNGKMGRRRGCGAVGVKRIGTAGVGEGGGYGMGGGSGAGGIGGGVGLGGSVRYGGDVGLGGAPAVGGSGGFGFGGGLGAGVGAGGGSSGGGGTEGSASGMENGKKTSMKEEKQEQLFPCPVMVLLL
ncbi:hypothetical protein ACLOJK_019831 [Asimina triloba]